MKSAEDFVSMVRGELGLPVTVESLEDHWDRIPGWDSLKLLWLASALERELGRPVELPDLLVAESLGHVYRIAVSAP